MTGSLTARAGLTVVVGALIAVAALWNTDGRTAARPGDRPLRVVATTAILADLVRQVGGRHVRSEPLVPLAGDPHSYDPRPADAARIARADVTFTNHLRLEEHALIKAIDANAPKGAPNVSLAESAEAYGARLRTLVEDVGVDVLWLGLRVRGQGHDRGTTRSSDVELHATRVTGPGRLIAYVTDALGNPKVLLDSGDGIDRRDVAVLPPAAHTHLNWAFTKPGYYWLTVRGTVVTDGRRSRLGRATFRFAVDVDPRRVDDQAPPTVLDGGHADITVDLGSGRLYAYNSRHAGEPASSLAPKDVVFTVPRRARTTVPKERRFSFLGRPGATIHQLPQAVIGKHVHGEIDPHVWQDVENTKAYVQLIRDTLVAAAPQHAEHYRAGAWRYLARLTRLDTQLRRDAAAIPRVRRRLVTTHDAFGYLAEAYGLRVVGFVVPHPAQQPSAEQVRTLGDTIRRLRVPAVFVEPNLAERARVLRQVAQDHGVRVCTLYGDALDRRVQTYISMMRHNGRELRRCLRTP